MKAKLAYRLIVGRTGRAPALLAEPQRVDHVEVVEIDGGEVVLFWDCPPVEASRLARRLRADLETLEDDDFLARWTTYEPGADADRPAPWRSIGKQTAESLR